MENRSGQSSSPPPSDPLERLRRYRVRPDRAQNLSEELGRQLGSVRTISRSEAAAIEAWETVVPDELAACCRVGGLSRGKLVLLVPDASRRYLTDRWLRGGGLGQLQALARVPIRGVDIRIDGPAGG